MKIGVVALNPQLDIRVEGEAWLKTFGEYVQQVKLLPADALERKAVRIRLGLVQGFKTVALRRGQAKREMKARGGRIKIRKSIREKYSKGTFLGGLINRKSKSRVTVFKKNKSKGETRKIKRFSWQDAVVKELEARQRSRSLLSASWVNRQHTYNSSELSMDDKRAGRTAKFSQNLKSNRFSNKVSIATTGNNPSILIQNFIEGVPKTDAQKGIIARVLRRETDDMMTYLKRKADRAAERLKK